MQEAVDAYFEDCDHRKKPYTVAGLALALGFATRQGLLNYEDGKRGDNEQVKAEFVDVVKRAKTRIEVQLEENLLEGKRNPAGMIFIGKNSHGLKDKVEVENTGNGVTVNIAAFGTPENAPQIAPQIAAQPQPMDTVSSGLCIETVKVQGVYEGDK